MNVVSALFPHSAQTRDVVVRVSVSFLADQSEPARGHWFWAYHIRIENAGIRRDIMVHEPSPM